MGSQALSQHEMQMYVGIGTLITLYVLSNLMKQKWPTMVSDSALCAELM